MGSEKKEMSTEQIAKDEKQRLTALLFDCGVRKARVDALDAVVTNTAWMKAKLDETRDMIKNTQVAIPYDNGGGQSGIRENPLFKGYESLWKSYMAGMNVITAAMPPAEVEREADKIETPKTVLQLVKARHGKIA